MGQYLSSSEANQNSTESMASNILEAIQPKKLRNPMVTILKEILDTIKLDDRLITENRRILKEFLDTFIPCMCTEDKLFASLFSTFYFTGSFYCNLRIVTPDEFDINVILNFKYKPEEFEVVYQPQVPSFAKYFLKNHLKDMKFFENGYLKHSKVRAWIQSVVDKALKHYCKPYSIHRIISSASGPARTLQIVKRSGDIIDIDLVPAIEHKFSTPPGIDGRVRAKFDNSLKGFLVPKPFSPTGQAPVNDSEISRLWRTHFPTPESDLLHNLGCAKSVIKLLKLLRDTEGWKILASYYLKTVVMWLVIENSSENFWKEDQMGQRFVDALERLQQYVSNKNLPYLFSKKCNLIYKMNIHQADNINNRLQRIIRDVKSNSWNLWKVFHVTPTFNMD